MEKSEQCSGEKSFDEALRDILSNKGFLTFDSFIIREMGCQLVDADSKEEVRKKAWKEFRQRTDKYAFSSYPTMKKWFGIGGFSKPRREQVFEICFALHLDGKKTESYLTKGLGEPSFQINDYQEAIFLYGLENLLSYKDCLNMIQTFELNLEEEQEFVQTHNTHQLLKQLKKNLPRDEFLLWMSDHADLFKGYSKTTLKYLEKCKKLILKYIRSDAREGLEGLLAETDFESWAKKKKGENNNREELIKKYMKSNRKRSRYMISENLGKNVLELSKLAYSEVEANTKLLAEVFSAMEDVKKEAVKDSSRHIRGMSGKRLSDLFNIPVQKERDIRTMQAYRVLSNLSDDVECPDWIRQLGIRYTKGKEQFQTVKEARLWLEGYRKEHRRRCLLVQRRDLLPMVLYVSQRRYLQEIEYQMENYKANDAKKVFEDLANSTLSACNMALLCDDFELDVALKACFQEEEMYSYSDVLDVVYGRREEAEWFSN